MTDIVQHKVLVYILRREAGQPMLLVFEHRDFPEAGIQVPVGTVEPGESPDAAAYREVLEESGLGRDRVRLARKLADLPAPEWGQHRHVFLFEPLTTLPDSWSHTVAGTGEDEGMVFNYYWLPITPDLALAGEQHRFLNLVARA